MRWLIIIGLFVFLSAESVWAQAGSASGSGAGAGGGAGSQGASTSGAARALWVIAAYAVSILLFAIELFLPSGGILAIGSAVAAIVGIVLMFQVSTAMGLIGLTLTILALPFLLAYSLKLLPDTPVFRWMTLRTPGVNESGELEAVEAENGLIGVQGVAQTDLYPSGTVLIDNNRYDAVSISGQIDKGQEVVVVSEDAFGLKVRRTP